MRLGSSLVFSVRIAAVAAISLAGCSWQKKESQVEGQSVKVQIPLYSTEGGYRMDVVELHTLQDVTHLKGLAARFLVDAQAHEGRLTGRPPALRFFRDSDGILVARDSLSLQLLTVYAQIERLMNLDREVGVGGVLTYPRTVAVNVTSRDQQGKVEANNALYSGQYDALIIQPFTKDSLPLMANAGVIGHEHFHALFQKLVVEPLKDKYPDVKRPTLHSEDLPAFENPPIPPSEPLSCSVPEDLSMKARTLYHATLFRGINEGFADAWGWVLTGDKGFVGRSLPNEKVRRDLEEQVQMLSPQCEILFAVERQESEAQLISYSYRHGTQLARTLRSFADLYASHRQLSDSEKRLRLGRWLMATLPELKKSFESLQDKELWTLSQTVAVFLRQVTDVNSNECYFVGKLMPADDRDRTSIVKICRDLERDRP